ncbi:hypothetical protein ACH5RR_014119 [Cinchona calisaya]|uniref:Uncharacterized protein n=1 Tax=Cinchona calisaya TaxID=153742 RepID=A0ABD3A203_9GENT
MLPLRNSLPNRVICKGKERWRKWAQKLIPRPSREEENIEDMKEIKTKQKSRDNHGMLPDEIVKLLAVSEKKVLSSDSGEEKPKRKPTLSKKRTKRLVYGAFPMLPEFTGVSRSSAILNNSDRALRLLSTSGSDVAIHSSHEHKSTKRSSSQNHSSVLYDTRKGDILDTSIKTLNDARETITKDSHKETEAIPTQNSKGNLTEKEVNAPNEEQPSKAVVAVSANGGKIPLVIFSPQALNATIRDLSCHNTCDKKSSESTSGRDRSWNRPKKGNKGNNARDLDMAIIDSEALIQGVPSSTIPLEQLAQYVFDDHEQRVDLVDDTLEEIEVSVTGPSKFDIFSNVVHTSLNANLTKNLDDGENDVATSQAMIQMENTIMTRRTPSIQTILLKQPLKTFKPPTWPLPSIVSEFYSEEVISNCQREYVSMLWRNLKHQISKTSLEHMSSLNKHATRFLEEMGSKTDISALQGLIKTFFENIET